ncbi:MAG: glycosyltransferase family 1 protein, partial [Armatimonadota bacterium]|nr:glycosyltransferase family 1 protein [Armatimonadota bacterium]
MRIAVDGLLLWGRYSGVERAIDRLVAALAADCGEHEYVVYVPADSPALRQPLPLGATGENLTFRAAPFRGANRVVRILWQHLCLPRVAAGDGAHLLFAPGYVLPLRWRRPSVLFIYDVIALSHPTLARRTNAWHYRLVLPLSARRATRIAVPSQHVRQQVVQWCGVPAAKVQVVPLGIDATFAPVSSASQREAVRCRYRLPPQFLLYVGNLEPKKNLERLLEAYALLRREGVPHHLVLAGKPGWGMERLRVALQRNPFRADIHLTGFVPDADLPALYSLADLFVFPSVVEGFGLPPLEAMACGTPVLVADVEPFHEIVGDAGVRVDPHDASAIAAGMKRVLTDASLRRRLTESGRCRAQAFTWERSARALRSLFAEATGAPDRLGRERGTPRLRGLVYLLAQFPSPTETFILREMQDLVRRGVPLTVYAFRGLQGAAPPHDALPLLDRVVYRSRPASVGCLTAHARVFARAPARYARVLARALWESRGRPARLRGRLVAFDAAVGLAAAAASEDVRH